MNRSVAVVLGSALAVGVALGAVAFSGSDTTGASASPTASDLHVVWTWTSKPHNGLARTRVESGSLQGGPGHGFVLVEVAGHRPAFYSGAAGTGAFQPTSPSVNTWMFRAADGSLLLVDPADARPESATTFTFLGPRLDPAKLGPIASRGVAVPLTWSWGAHHHSMTAVVLVESTKGWPGWKLDGYLPGFSVPRPSLREPELKRPLVGPDGHAYSVDATRGRLVRDTAWHGSTAPGYRPYPAKFGACNIWPAARGGSYLACPNSIVLRTADGATVTLLQRHLQFAGDRAWGFVQPSPDGKWLLLQDTIGACGTGMWADFLPASGGELRSAFQDAETSEPLGWLPDNSALVAVQSTGCEGAPVGGVYEVWPDRSWSGGPSSQLVFPGQVVDATTWGFGR